MDEKEFNKELDSGRSIDSLQRDWEKNHYGETVDKMMAVDFNEFPKEAILGAAIVADIVEKDQNTLDQFEEMGLSEELINNSRKIQLNHRKKVIEKLSDLSGISDEDVEKFEEITGIDSGDGEGLLKNLNVAYRMQKKVFFMRKGKETDPLLRKEEKNNEFTEAAQAYVDADSVKSMHFFEEVFGDDFNNPSEFELTEESESQGKTKESEPQQSEDYDITEVDEGVVISGRKTENEKIEDDLVEQVGVAKGSLLLRSIKEGKYNSAEDLLNSDAIINSEIRQGLEALKVRAIKEGDSKKVDYINKILN